MTETRIRTSLQRAPSAPAGLDDLRAKARVAWHKNVPDDDIWLCVRLGDIVSWEDRAMAVNIGNRINGKRGAK